jgi:hypothetical protein
LLHSGRRFRNEIWGSLDKVVYFKAKDSESIDIFVIHRKKNAPLMVNCGLDEYLFTGQIVIISATPCSRKQFSLPQASPLSEVSDFGLKRTNYQKNRPD